MQLFKPLHYTPKQWVAFCNTFLLLLVTSMCGLVIYEISILDQRFVSVLDSSLITIDLLAVNLLNSHMTPFWKNVTDDISVYSAFYEIQSEEDNHILIIGSRSRNEIHSEELRCLIQYGEEDDISIGYVDFEAVPEYSTLFLYCYTRSEEIPKKVSLISYANTISKHWMQVDVIYPRIERDLNQQQIAACVHPLTGKVTVKKIAKFLSFYELIGINHFYFYDYNATGDAIDFLRHKIGSGYSIHILPWNKETTNGDLQGLWSEQTQDCLHRAIYMYDDVITIDVFDFFFPVEHTSLVDLLGNLSMIHGRPSELRLNRANFCKTLEDYNFSTNVALIKNKMYLEKSHPSYTNYILRPEVVAGIKFQGSFTSVDENNFIENLSEDYGIIHRYRKSCDENTTLDTSLNKYNMEPEKSKIFEKYKKRSRRNITKAIANVYL